MPYGLLSSVGRSLGWLGPTTAAGPSNANNATRQSSAATTESMPGALPSLGERLPAAPLQHSSSATSVGDASTTAVFVQGRHGVRREASPSPPPMNEDLFWRPEPQVAYLGRPSSAFRLPTRRPLTKLAPRIHEGTGDQTLAGLNMQKPTVHHKRNCKPGPRKLNGKDKENAVASALLTTRPSSSSRTATTALRVQNINARPSSDGSLTVTDKNMATKDADATMVLGSRVRATPTAKAVQPYRRLSPPPALPPADYSASSSSTQTSSAAASLVRMDTRQMSSSVQSSTPLRVVKRPDRANRRPPPPGLPSPPRAGSSAAGAPAPPPMASTPPAASRPGLSRRPAPPSLTSSTRAGPSALEGPQQLPMASTPPARPRTGNAHRSPPPSIGDTTTGSEQITEQNSGDDGDETARSCDAELSADVLAGLGLAGLPGLTLVHARPSHTTGRLNLPSLGLHSCAVVRTNQLRVPKTVKRKPAAAAAAATATTALTTSSQRITMAVPAVEMASPSVGPVRSPRTSPRTSPLRRPVDLGRTIRPGASVAARVAALEGLNELLAATSTASAASTPRTRRAFRWDTSCQPLSESLVAAFARERRRATTGVARREEEAQRLAAERANRGPTVGQARFTLLSPDSSGGRGSAIGQARITLLSPDSSAASDSYASSVSASLSPAPSNFDSSPRSSSGASQLALAVRSLSFEAADRSHLVQDVTRRRIRDMRKTVALRRQRQERELARQEVISVERQREAQEASQAQRDHDAEVAAQRQPKPTKRKAADEDVAVRHLNRQEVCYPQRYDPCVEEDESRWVDFRTSALIIEVGDARFAHPSPPRAHKRRRALSVPAVPSDWSPSPSLSPSLAQHSSVAASADASNASTWAAEASNAPSWAAAACVDLAIPLAPSAAALADASASFVASTAADGSTGFEAATPSAQRHSSHGTSTPATATLSTSHNAEATRDGEVRIVVSSPASLSHIASPACASCPQCSGQLSCRACDALLAPPQHLVSDRPPAQLVAPLEADHSSDSNVVRAIWSPTAGLGPGFQDESLENVFVTRCKVCDPTWFRRDGDGDVVMKDVADCTC